MLSTVLVLLFATVATVKAEVCQDVDSHACLKLAETDPHFCSSHVAAESLCKRYCGHCVLQCFSCENVVESPEVCKAVKSCRVGELCSIGSIRTSAGVESYKLGCLENEVCRGATFLSVLGRRRRDASLHCCDTDQCNNVTSAPSTQTTPTTPTTPTAPTKATSTTKSTTAPASTSKTAKALGTSLATAKLTPTTPCTRSVVFLVEDSYELGISTLESMKHLLSLIVSGMNIGRGRDLVAVATFDKRVAIELPMTSYQNTTTVIDAIMNITSHHFRPDLVGAIHDLKSMMSLVLPDAIVLVTNGRDDLTNPSSDGRFRMSPISAIRNYVSEMRREGVATVSMEIGNSQLQIDPYLDYVIRVPDFQVMTLMETMKTFFTTMCAI